MVIAKLLAIRKLESGLPVDTVDICRYNPHNYMVHVHREILLKLNNDNC